MLSLPPTGSGDGPSSQYLLLVTLLGFGVAFAAVLLWRSRGFELFAISVGQQDPNGFVPAGSAPPRRDGNRR